MQEADMQRLFTPVTAMSTGTDAASCLDDPNPGISAKQTEWWRIGRPCALHSRPALNRAAGLAVQNSTLLTSRNGTMFGTI